MDGKFFVSLDEGYLCDSYLAVLERVGAVVVSSEETEDFPVCVYNTIGCCCAHVPIHLQCSFRRHLTVDKSLGPSGLATTQIKNWGPSPPHPAPAMVAEPPDEPIYCNAPNEHSAPPIFENHDEWLH